MDSHPTPESSSATDQETPARRRLFTHGHKRRPLHYWLIPLLIILGVMFFLPRLLDRLG